MGHRRAQMLRRKTRLSGRSGKGRGGECRTERHATTRFVGCAVRHVARREAGIPATKDCDAYRREDDGSGGAGSGSEAETPSTAPNSRGCHARSRSGPTPSGPKQGVASCAGLAPEGVYVYAERGEGRTNRPPCTGSTVAPTVTACWKANRNQAVTAC